MSGQITITQIARKIVLVLACLLGVTAIASWGALSLVQPSFSQSTPRFSLTQPNSRIFTTGDIEYASIFLDGSALLEVGARKVPLLESESDGSLPPLERRVRRIEGTLRNIVNTGFNPKTLEVETATLNNLTVITATDRQNLARQIILTVTEIDAQIGSASVDELAQQWSQIIRTALIQAWQVRQPEARKRQIAVVATLILVMVMMSFLLVWGQNLLKKRFKRLKKRAKEEFSQALDSDYRAPLNEADYFFTGPLAVLSTFRQQADLQQKITLNILLQKLDRIGFILLWFSGVAAILSIFPETRLEGRGVMVIPLRIFIIWLVLTLISNLVILYISYKLQEWVEEGSVVSDNPQRRILRAPTLLEVSQGIIGFASFWVGIIWFLAWKGFFPSSYLTGAGLLGAAATFAFRNLFIDWINGILIIFEDQYAVGDVIEFEGWVGLVENMSLRATQIRTPDGRLSTIPHNQITIAHNLTKDWSRVNFMIEVAYDTDPTVAIELMKQISQEMAEDPQWQKDIIDPVNVIGVNSVAHSGIEMIIRIKVKRLRQWDVAREFRRRLKLAFDEKGIQIGIPKQSLLFSKKTDEKPI